MIKAIELQGFKSFEKKITIPLSSGFTAIVGPNGSGKSNVCDSMCFALGRSQARSMRAERLTHLIYSGGHGKSASKSMEVTLVLENENRKLPFDSDEVRVTRRLTKNGTMSFKINGQTSTKSQVIDALSSAGLTASGHNIVMQGDITSFIEMTPTERREVIDEISGIAEYNEKRDKAQKDLDVVEDRIKELVIVMAERKKQLGELRKEKEDAEKYNELKKEETHLGARLAFTKFKQIETEVITANDKIAAEEEKLAAITKEFELANKILTEKQVAIKKMDQQLIGEGGGLQLALKNELGRLHGQISIDQSKIESKQGEISNIDSMVTRLQSITGESDKGSKAHLLKGQIQGIHGSVGDLLTVESKYRRAVEASLGGRINYIIVENEDVAIRGIEYLRSNKMGRATFLPLTKIRGPELSDIKDRHIFGLAARVVKYDQAHANIFKYLFGNTYIVDDLKNTKHLIGKFRMVSLEGDVAEKSGAMSGGSYKKKSNTPNTEIDEYVKQRDVLLDEINALQLSIQENEKKLEETSTKATKMGADFETLQQDRGTMDSDIDKLRERTSELSLKKDNQQRAISDVRVEKARVDAKLVDIELNVKRYAQENLEVGDIKSMEARLVEVSREIQRIEPVNMKAIELYAEMETNYKEFEGRFTKLQTERNSVIDFIADIEQKKKTVFFDVFNKVSAEFSDIFPKLSPNGEAKLVLEDPDDPLYGGMLVEAKPAGKKLLSIESMSGGEKVLTALSFLFALQRYNPAPFYVLDEVDAALDQNNSMRFVDLLQDTVKNAQLLVISHNNSVIKRAERLFGVSMQANGTSNVVGIELGDAETIKQYADEPKSTGGDKVEF